jgi:hypothetical protein
MIEVLPQTEHPHRNANGETTAAQSQLVSGCFIGGALLVGLGLDVNCSELTRGCRCRGRSILTDSTTRYGRRQLRCGISSRPMSAWGQTRTLDNVRVTSGKLLIADSKRTFSYVRSGPITEVVRLNRSPCKNTTFVTDRVVGTHLKKMPEWRFPTQDFSLVHLGNRNVPRPIRLFTEFAARMDLPT